MSNISYASKMDLELINMKGDSGSSFNMSSVHWAKTCLFCCDVVKLYVFPVVSRNAAAV